jgi:IS5 family transposase
VDQGSGLVRRAILTPGHVSGKAPFLDLVQGNDQAVYTDKGYDGAWYRARWVEQGIADGVMAGDFRQRPLDAAGRARNRAIGVVPVTGRAHLRDTPALVRLPPGPLAVPDQERLQLQLLAVI